MPKPQPRNLKLKLSDIDANLLPPEVRRAGASAQVNAASQLVRKLFREIGGVIQSLAFTGDQVAIAWQPESGVDPVDPIVKMLKDGRHHEAALLAEILLSDDEHNPQLLYNLGMAYSDLGRLDRAVTLLQRLLTIEPGHTNGRVALGVALTRQARFTEAETELRRAVQDAPENPWAHRNLGACLMNLDRADEAVRHLQLAVGLNSQDERAWLGLGKALEITGDLAGADAAYRRVVEIDEAGETAARAKQALAKMAGDTFRGATPGMPRMDAVMYCLSALQKFEQLTRAKSRNRHEVAPFAQLHSDDGRRISET